MWRFTRRLLSTSNIAKESEQILSTELSGEISNYTKALDLVKENNFSEAESNFRKTLEILTNKDLYGQPVYNFVLQRIALLLRAQHKARDCEKVLEEIVMNCKAKEKEYSHQLGSACENLLKQYLQTNLDKAIKFGVYLSKDSNWKVLHRHSQKDLKFLIGVIYK